MDQLILYVPQQHETLGVAWFFKLRQTGDLDKVCYTTLHTITNFLSYWANSVKLLFKADNDGIYFAAWAHPIMAAGEFGLWIREDKRHSSSTLKLVYEAYDKAFDVYPVLLGVSKQSDLRKIHEHLGYVFNAEVPNVWDGQPAQFYYLTKEAYYGRRSGRSSTSGRATTGVSDTTEKQW